jgi:hypothetical protein
LTTKIGLVGLAAVLAGTAPADAETDAKPPFGAGQVWAYQSRPGDEASVLRINRIDKADIGFVVHISVVGIHWCGHPTASSIDHVAISSAALRQSVTHIAKTRLVFPDEAKIDAAIKRWDDDQAGFMKRPLNEIVSNFDESACINRWDNDGNMIEPAKPVNLP